MCSNTVTRFAVTAGLLATFLVSAAPLAAHAQYRPATVTADGTVPATTPTTAPDGHHW